MTVAGVHVDVGKRAVQADVAVRSCDLHSADDAAHEHMPVGLDDEIEVGGDSDRQASVPDDSHVVVINVDRLDRLTAREADSTLLQLCVRRTFAASRRPAVHAGVSKLDADWARVLAPARTSRSAVDVHVAASNEDENGAIPWCWRPRQVAYTWRDSEEVSAGGRI